MKIRRNSRKAHGAGFSYSNSANDLFHEKIYEDNSHIETLVDALLVNKVASIDSGAFKIKFEISRKNLLTTYLLPGGKELCSTHKYDSIFANNEPGLELYLEIAKAECNAKIAGKTGDLVLYNYPAVGFYVSKEEAGKIKYKLRQLAKHPFFYRFK
jgi:hypothetical protein